MLLGVLIMFSCVNIEYLNLRVTGLQTLTFYMRLFFILFIVARSMFRHLQQKKIYFIWKECMFFIFSLFWELY